MYSCHRELRTVQASHSRFGRCCATSHARVTDPFPHAQMQIGVKDVDRSRHPFIFVRTRVTAAVLPEPRTRIYSAGTELADRPVRDDALEVDDDSGPHRAGRP
jgi:hypothetical protein